MPIASLIGKPYRESRKQLTAAALLVWFVHGMRGMFHSSLNGEQTYQISDPRQSRFQATLVLVTVNHCNLLIPRSDLLSRAYCFHFSIFQDRKPFKRGKLNSFQICRLTFFWWNYLRAHARSTSRPWRRSLLSWRALSVALHCLKVIKYLHHER